MESYVVPQKWKKLIVLTSRPNSAFLPCGASYYYYYYYYYYYPAIRRRWAGWFTGFVTTSEFFQASVIHQISIAIRHQVLCEMIHSFGCVTLLDGTGE